MTLTFCSTKKTSPTPPQLDSNNQPPEPSGPCDTPPHWGPVKADMPISWPCQRREGCGSHRMDGIPPWRFNQLGFGFWILEVSDGSGGKMKQKFQERFRDVWCSGFFWRQTHVICTPRAIWELKFPLKLFATKGCNEWRKLLGKLRKHVWDIAEFGNYPPETLDKHCLTRIWRDFRKKTSSGQFFIRHLPLENVSFRHFHLFPSAFG